MYLKYITLRNALLPTIFLMVIPNGKTINCNKKVGFFSYKIRDHPNSECLTCLGFRNMSDTFEMKACTGETNALNQQVYQIIYQYRINYNAYYIRQSEFKSTNNGTNYWYGDDSNYNYYNGYRGDMNKRGAISLENNSNLTTIENGPPPNVGFLYYILSLSNNAIRSIAPGSFNTFFNLIILNLARNEISKLDTEAFYGLVQLQTLNLQFNKIEMLDEKVFKPLVELFHIDLSNNKLTYIPSNLFIHQKHLSAVILNNNEISVLECICWNSPNFVMDEINLSWNKINKTHLNTNATKVLLDHNSLIHFSANTVEFSELRLDYNNLTKFNVSLSAMMNSLNLSHNRFKSLPTSDMRNLQQLKFLDISNNFLTQPNFGSKNNWISLFLHLNNLREVSIDRNLWKCNDLNEMIQTFKFRSIQVTPGNEHKKNNILGISCIDNGNNNLANSTIDPEFIEKVFEEMWNRIANKSHTERDISNLNIQINQLKNITMKFNKTLSDQSQTNLSSNITETLKAMSTKLENLETQMSNFSSNFNISLKFDGVESEIGRLEAKIKNVSVIDSTPKINVEINDINSKLKDLQTKYGQLKNTISKPSDSYNENLQYANTPSTSDLGKDSNVVTSNLELIKLVKYLSDIRASKIPNRPEDQFNINKIEKLLESISGSSVSVQTCLIILLVIVVIISFIIISAYIMIRRNRPTSRETIALVQS